MKAHPFTDLEAWQVTHRVVLAARERFGRTSPLRRAAISIRATIAEGFARRTRPDKARIHTLAQGS